MSLYAARASEKLRQQNGLVKTLHVFMHTSPHLPNFKTRSATIELPFPTNDTRTIVGTARRTATAIYTEGHAYLKAGVGLVELIDRNNYQEDFWKPEQSEKADRLMQVVDKINRKEGKGTVFLAAQGIKKPWAMRQNFKSPFYTTRWADIPMARC